jgi:probable rRNA maturation factor
MTEDEYEDHHYFEIRNVSIAIDDDGWFHYADISQWLEKVVQDEAFSILLTNDDHIQQLNRDFRNKDNPTNVLSFPDGEEGYLGDIAITLETIAKEAKEQDKDFYHHFTHMVIHGLMHLKGYDHDNDEEAEQMESIEIKILADIGIKNPYI